MDASSSPGDGPSAALAALLSSILPEEWRNEITVLHRDDQIVLRFCDGEGRAHAFDVRRRAPGAPSFVPDKTLAYSYLSTAEQPVEHPVLERYRASLEALAAREDELIPWLSEAPRPPTADPVRAEGIALPGSLNEGSPEWIAFEAGLKSAIRVVLPGPGAVEALARAVRARAWGFFAADDLVQFPSGAQRIGYIARTDADARALADAEAPSEPGGRRVADNSASKNALVGRLLGYPPCCADAFAQRMSRDVHTCPDGRYAHEDYVAAATALRASGRLLGRLNNLLPDRGSPRLITYYPCRYDCPAAGAFAGALLAAVAQRSPRQAALWRASLVGRRGIDRRGRRLGPGETSPHDPLWLDFDEF